MASQITRTALALDSTLSTTDDTNLGVSSAGSEAAQGEVSELPTAASDSKGRFRCDIEGCGAAFDSRWGKDHHIEAHRRGTLKCCFKCGTTWSYNRFCGSCLKILQSSGSSICKDCVRELPLESFTVSKKGLFGREMRCKGCLKQHNARRRSTLDGFLGMLYQSCVLACKLRAKAGRTEAAMITLTKADFRKMWDDQDGKCYYSGLAMSTESHANWKCSPERLDVTKGYIDGNVKLVCYEFNGPRQWSLRKIQQIRPLLESSAVDNFQALVEMAKKKPVPVGSGKAAITKIEDGRVLVRCAFCTVYKPESEMKHAQCTMCFSNKKKLYRSTIRGRLHALLDGAKLHCKNMSKVQTSSRTDSTCTITVDDLFALLLAQKGRCAYSNIPLTFDGGDWKVSIERLDCGIGYHKTNISLICVEFNTVDNSCRGEQRNIGGSGAWSVQKFRQLLAALESNDKTDMAQQ
jgi:hypothetical protein